MFLNTLKYLDSEMKTSIKKQVLLNKIKNAPTKAFYTYLIIDVGKLSTCMQSKHFSSLMPVEPTIDDFLAFKSSIFYVGKGILNRKHQHLTLAKQLFCGILPLKKVQLRLSKIVSLWRKNMGVSIIQLDCDATAYEAFTRENCIIKSLNFNRLTNRIRGTSYGDAKFWPIVKITNYGDMLLYQLFKSFLAKPPNIIYDNDVILYTAKTKKPRLCINVVISK